VVTKIGGAKLGNKFSFVLFTPETRTLLSGSQTYTKPSALVKYLIKFGSAANPIANSKLVEEYVPNNKPNGVF
jgi:hypothetical protein